MNSKERDNTWLQLPVCPTIWRQKEKDKEEGDDVQACAEDQPCRSSYAHPPKHVLTQALASGYVVSCQVRVLNKYSTLFYAQPFE